MIVASIVEREAKNPDEYGKVVMLRRALTGVPPVEAMELLLGKLKKTRSNIEFLLTMNLG